MGAVIENAQAINATQMEEMSPDVVIMVHGTGAADDADRGPSWWQSNSGFETAFSKLVEPFAATAKPFHWSGVNSEVDRRAAGLALLRRLLQLDSAGVNYHLIGHSHGGSVIWHALVASMLRGKPLSGLRSWSTIGTPFLQFRAVAPSPWRWIALAVVALALYWTGFGRADRTEWVPAIVRLWANGQWLDLVYVGVAFVTLFLLAIWALMRVVAPIVRRARDSSTTMIAETAAKQRYGSKWLGLWHPLDEPINALSGTLGEAPVIPVIGPIAYRVVMRAADEFAWLQITRRAQGSNLSGYQLLRVGRAPVALEPGYAAIDRAIADKIETSADGKAVDSVSRFRALMETAYDTQSSDPIFRRISSIVSFQELVHTSYFDYSETGAILTAHICHLSSRRERDPDAPLLPDPDVVVPSLLPPDIESPVRVNSNTRRNLEVLIALGIFIGPALLLALAANAVFDAKVSPETDQFQIKAIMAEFNKPQSKSDRYSEAYGSVIVRLAQLGVITDPIAAVTQLAEKSTRSSGAIALAKYFGEKNDWRSVEKLIVTPALVESDDTATPNLGEQGLRLQAVFAAVARAPVDLRQDKGLRDMIDTIDVEASSLLRTETNSKRIRSFPWEEWGTTLVKLKEYDRVKRLLVVDSASVAGPRPGEVNRARCTLANTLRAEEKVNVLQIGLREWAETCLKTIDADSQLDSLLEESLRAPGPDAEALKDILPQFDRIEAMLNEVIAAMRLRRPEEKPPELRVNLKGKIMMRQIASLYRFGQIYRTAELAKFNNAITNFLDVSDDALKLERLTVVVSLIESIVNQTNAFPPDPFFKEILKSSSKQVLEQSLTILNEPEVNRNFDDNSLFSKVPRLLSAADLDGLARQFFRDLHWRLRNKYQGALGGWATLYLAATAKTINYREFAAEYLSEGIAALRMASDTRTHTEDELAEYVMLGALTAGVDFPELTRRSLKLAEYNLDLIKNSEKRTELLPDMVRLWVSLGELPKARALADSAPASDIRMSLYLPVLDKIIANRKLQ